MNSRILFWISYISMNIIPLYVILALFFFQENLSKWAILLPIFFIGVPSGIFLALYKCKNCNNRVYTVSHLKSVPGGLKRVPLYLFKICPECNQQL